MAEIKLFSLEDNVTELPASAANFEMELQHTIEKNTVQYFSLIPSP